jgi:hypothetical protein
LDRSDDEYFELDGIGIDEDDDFALVLILLLLLLLEDWLEIAYIKC